MVHIGVQLYPADPYWVLVREAIEQQAHQLGMQLTPITLDVRGTDQHWLVSETLLAQRFDGIISFYLDDPLLAHILDAGIPVVYLNETSLRHPLLATSGGLYESGLLASTYIAERLAGQGHVFVISGVLQAYSSRIRAVHTVFARYPNLTIHSLPCASSDRATRLECRAALQQRDTPIDAILGLYDSLAMMGYEFAHELGLLSARVVVVGINGDPLALAAILAGRMAATVDTDPARFGADAVNLMHDYVARQQFTTDLVYNCRLVTAQNVAEVAVHKLISTASIPSRLVGINRYEEQQHVSQLETSLAISRQAHAILDREQLTQAIVERIREHLGYDTVQLFRWLPQQQALVLNAADGPLQPLTVDPASPMGQALAHDEVVFIPDARHSQRFLRDPAHPATVSRVIVPLHRSDSIVGLVDLHSGQVFAHTTQELMGFQSLVDQLGVALRNAELYAEAVQARAQAEQADMLKTRLLANVSHELRTPLHLILGYSQAILTQPQLYTSALPVALLEDIGHVYRNGEHLIRLINDLLDLSRAEIGELELYPEPLDPRALLHDVFHSIAAETDASAELRWQLDLPAHLPYLQADQMRLRQVLLNLLSNARKFTAQGKITLGAEVEPPYLHIWVADTGCGVPPEIQERIFEPFIVGDHPQRRREGAGLGLSIVRRFVALHHGTVTLQSSPGQGSTFSIYLPLPNLDGLPVLVPQQAMPMILLVGGAHQPAPLIEDLCARRQLVCQRLAPGDDLERLFATVRPIALAWDTASAQPEDWALIARIRAHPRGSQLPCMLYVHPAADQPAQIGTTNLLLKPLRVATLLEVVAALRPDTPTGSVLVVDDDSQARAYYQRLLEDALPGYQIISAQHGLEALATLEQHLPSLILLDLMMPEMDGFAVLEAIRSQARTRHIPVLVLSGQILSEQDVRRLDFARVLFQSKGVLSPAETAARLQTLTQMVDWLPAQTSVLVKAAVAYIQHHYSDPTISRQQIAEHVGVSESYLTRLFQEELNLSLWDYLNRFRIRHARTLLRSTTASINEVAARSGFDDPSYFARVFRKLVGSTPLAYRKEPAVPTHEL